MIGAVAFEPNAAQLLVVSDSSDWHTRCFHDRSWHLFRRDKSVAVLRLVEHGSFVAQCNMSPIPAAAAGPAVSLERFVSDIQRTLGKNVASIESTERIKTGDNRSIFRVVAAGKSRDIPVRWIYFLIAAPDGRQMTMVFTVEATLVGKLGDRDIRLAGALEFLPTGPEPTRSGTSSVKSGTDGRFQK